MDTSALNRSPLDTSMDQSIYRSTALSGAPSAGAFFLPRPLALASYAALRRSPWGSGGFNQRRVVIRIVIPWIGHFLHGHHHPPHLKWINYSKLNEQILRWHDMTKYLEGTRLDWKALNHGAERGVPNSMQPFSADIPISFFNTKWRMSSIERFGHVDVCRDTVAEANSLTLSDQSTWSLFLS